MDHFTEDEISIQIGPVTMRVKRKFTLLWPHEVSAYVPRAEFRRRTFREGKLQLEEEMLLNSLTIVHAPLHPPHNPRPAAGGAKPPSPSYGPGPAPSTIRVPAREEKSQSRHPAAETKRKQEPPGTAGSSKSKEHGSSGSKPLLRLTFRPEPS